MRILIMAIALAFAMIQSASAAVYQQGVVYVIYENNDITNKADINSNGVPDIVEDIATQMNAAREIFAAFNFPDPLKSERYPNVTSIEVDMEAAEKGGTSFSGMRKNSKHNPNERALHISIGSIVDPHKGETPAHEYFHLIQYGATYFRNGWFLEGMARWSQDSVAATKYPNSKNVSATLKSKSEQEKIFKIKYNAAEKLWYPLALSMNDKATIPDKIISKYKYVDGSPVFKDNVFYGANVMRKVILTMKSKEAIAAEQFGGMRQWRKDGQRDEKNNPFIMESVREVYNSGK